MPPAGARDVVRFAEKALLLLDQGGFTATYKFAVLLGLMDLCLEASARDGTPPDLVTTRQLARKVVELYWPQTATFEGQVLLQNRGGQAEIVTLIHRFRHSHAHGSDPSAPLHRAQLAAPAGFARLVEAVEWKLVEMPLPKLQRVGRTLDEFIYTLNWSDDVRRTELRSADFDNRLLFKPGAAACLVELAGLLRPLVHRQWVALVTKLNGRPESELEEFLFGRSRVNLEPVRGPLLDLQDGRCFYCDARLTRGAHVDHFLPWARHPDGSVHNLVVAHDACNGAKSDFLASADHVARWTNRVARRRGDLLTLARDLSWECDEARTVAVTRAVYAHLPDDARLWVQRRDFVPLDRPRLDRAFGSLSAATQIAAPS